MLAEGILAQPNFLEPTKTNYEIDLDEEKQEWIKNHNKIPEDLIDNLSFNKKETTPSQRLTLKIKINIKKQLFSLIDGGNVNIYVIT